MTFQSLNFSHIFFLIPFDMENWGEGRAMWQEANEIANNRLSQYRNKTMKELHEFEESGNPIYREFE